jgi:hypothetical protein
MSLTVALTRGRAAAEALMVDTCTVRRGGTPTYDDTTGGTTPAWTPVYSGSCRLDDASAPASASTVGEAAVLLAQPEIHLPISAVLLLPGDEITITACPNDPVSVGRVFRVKSKQGQTARRYQVIERTS